MSATLPEGLCLVSEISALDGYGYEYRKRIVTDAADHLGGGEDWSDPDQVECWREWIDRAHQADCRLAELRIERGSEIVEEALANAGVQDAEWEHIPDCLETAIAALEADA